MTDQITRPGGSTTINEFCALERTSRTQLYKLWAEGRGPRYYKNGNRRRITSSARSTNCSRLRCGKAGHFTAALFFFSPGAGRWGRGGQTGSDQWVIGATGVMRGTGLRKMLSASTRYILTESFCNGRRRLPPGVRPSFLSTVHLSFPD